MSRNKTKSPGLPRHVYPTKRKAKPYRLKRPDGTFKSYATLAELLPAWNAHYGDEVSTGLVSHYIDQYLAGPVLEKRESTQKDYTRQLANIRKVFGHMHIAEVEPHMIKKWQTARAKKSVHQCNREKSAFSNVFQMAVDNGELSANPCRQIRKLTEYARERDVTAAEFWHAFDNVSPTIQAAMLLIGITGIRPGDLVELTRANWNDDGLHYTENKSMKGADKRQGRKRKWPWTDGLRRAYQLGIDSQVRTSLHWLTGSTGQPFKVTTLGQRFKNELSRVDVYPFQLRDLRAFAANESADGVALLQHSSAAVTRVHYMARRPISTKANL